MCTKCFELDAGGHLVRVERTDAVTRWRAGSGVFWIDFESPDAGELAQLLLDIGLDRELVDQLLDSSHAARILPPPNSSSPCRSSISIDRRVDLRPVGRIVRRAPPCKL